MKIRELPAPEIVIKRFATAGLFYSACDLPLAAKLLLTVVSNFAAHDSNLYKLADTRRLATMLGLTHSQLIRSKRQLRDAGLVDYNGGIGDLSKIIKRWETQTGETWEYRLK